MSYILEALRRAQGERPQSPPPAPQPATDEAPPMLRGLRALPLPAQAALAGAAAAMVVLLLAWAVWPAREAAAPPTVPAAAPAAPLPTLPAISERPTITSMDDLTESDYGTQSGIGGELIAALPEEFSETPAETQMPAENPIPEEPQPQTSIRTVELEPAPPNSVTPLREMPEDFRAAFPAFKIEVHAYDSDPALRFVLIEGRRYREGETLAQGPQLAAITADGVVLSFRGSEVLLPAQ